MSRIDYTGWWGRVRFYHRVSISSQLEKLNALQVSSENLMHCLDPAYHEAGENSCSQSLIVYLLMGFVGQRTHLHAYMPPRDLRQYVTVFRSET